MVPRFLPTGGLNVAEFAATAVERKLRLLDEGISENGRNDTGPERSILVFGIFDTVNSCEPGGWIPPELVDKSPHTLIGSPLEVVDAILERRHQLGISYYVCSDYELDRMKPIVAAFRAHESAHQEE